MLSKLNWIQIRIFLWYYELPSFKKYLLFFSINLIICNFINIVNYVLCEDNTIDIVSNSNSNNNVEDQQITKKEIETRATLLGHFLFFGSIYLWIYFVIDPFFPPHEILYDFFQDLKDDFLDYYYPQPKDSDSESEIELPRIPGGHIDPHLVEIKQTDKEGNVTVRYERMKPTQTSKEYFQIPRVLGPQKYYIQNDPISVPHIKLLKPSELVNAVINPEELENIKNIKKTAELDSSLQDIKPSLKTPKIEEIKTAENLKLVEAKRMYIIPVREEFWKQHNLWYISDENCYINEKGERWNFKVYPDSKKIYWYPVKKTTPEMETTPQITGLITTDTFMGQELPKPYIFGQEAPKPFKYIKPLIPKPAEPLIPKPAEPLIPKPAEPLILKPAEPKSPSPNIYEILKEEEPTSPLVGIEEKINTPKFISKDEGESEPECRNS